MSYETQSCDHYLLLKPDNASFGDLFRFLFSSESETSRFIESTEELKGDFWRRWFIFNSLFVQKLLLKVGNPMVQIGHVFEFWLNLLSSNGGLLKLLTNFLTGLVNYLIFIYILFYVTWSVLIEHLIGYIVVNLQSHIYNPHACMQ
jgi:hypothetical protein